MHAQMEKQKYLYLLLRRISFFADFFVVEKSYDATVKNLKKLKEPSQKNIHAYSHKKYNQTKTKKQNKNKPVAVTFGVQKYIFVTRNINKKL